MKYLITALLLVMLLALGVAWAEQPADAEYLKDLPENPENLRFTVTWPDGTTETVDSLDKIATYDDAAGAWKLNWKLLYEGKTNAKGEIIKNLPPDSIIKVEEIKAPAGYAIDDANKTKIIDLSKTQEAKFVNKELTEITVKKEWKDNDNQDGKRPEKVTVSLHGLHNTVVETRTIEPDAQGKWTTTFTDLPVYHDGDPINYWVSEVRVKDYTPNLPVDVNGVITLTNKYTPGKTGVTVWKDWEDNDDQDGIRPTSVQVTLLADGARVREATLNDANEWKYEFENLDINANGQPILYTVQEVDVPEGYETQIKGDAKEGYEITNSHTPETIDIPVTKVWNDNDDAAQARPEKVIVWLHVDGVEKDRIELTAKGEWKGAFTNLPVYKKGVKIVYTVTEEPVTGYTRHFDENTYTITNTYDPTHTDVEVEKHWDMGDHTDVEHPESVTVKLLADGVDTGKTLELNAENKWEGEFEGLELKKNDNLIVYTVEEIPIDNYATQVVKEDDYDFLIINKYDPKPEPEPQPPTPYYPDEPGGFTNHITFTKEWRGDVGDHIDYTVYYPDGTIRVNRLPLKYKKSETEWVYEGYVSSAGECYIIEDAQPGYKVRYENVAPYENVKDRCYNGGRIINYKVPKTGDSATLALWIGLAVLGLGGLSAAMLLRKRRSAQR